MSKYFVILLALTIALAAYESHEFDMGIPVETGLNYQYDGEINIYLRYTTKYLTTFTGWYDPANFDDEFYAGWENEFESFYDDEKNQLYLEIDI